MVSTVLVLALTAAALVTAPTPAAAGEVVDGRFPTEEAFVDQTYRDLLSRGPDAGGMTFWADRIRAGLPPEAFVEQLLLSPEFGGVIAPVVRLYSSVFDRRPDADGLRFWIAQRRAGMTLERMASHFVASAEFDDLAAATTTEEYIAAVYRRSLGT